MHKEVQSLLHSVRYLSHSEAEAYKPYAKRYKPMHKEVQTLLRSVRYLSHSEAVAYKPYANDGKSYKSLSAFCVIGVHPI